MVILSCVSIVATATQNLPETTNGKPQVVAPSSREALCEFLLSRLTAVEDYEDEHPLSTFFSVFGLMLNNSSGVNPSYLNSYSGLQGLSSTTELIGLLNKREDRQRKSHITEIYQLFVTSAKVGQDFNVASLLYGIERLTQSIISDLFFSLYDAHGRKGDPERFRLFFMNPKKTQDPEAFLELIRDSWDHLSAPHRAAFAEWLGRVFTETVNSYTTLLIEVNHGARTVSQRSWPSLPELNETLDDYLEANPGNRVEQSKRYYRKMAAKILIVYGITYSESEPVTDSQSLPAPRPARLLDRLELFLLGRK